MHRHADRALVLAPHTDDAELGAGGTIARLLEAGTALHVVVFSIATASVPAGPPPTTLRDEFLASAATYGLADDAVTVLDYPVRHFPAHRQEILEELVALRSRLRPDLVIAPASVDVHQDHRTVHTEAVRAFKGVTLWGYDLPWNDTDGFRAQVFVALTPEHLAAKRRALDAYRSQADRPYFAPGYVESLARTRGVQVGFALAEAFELVRAPWPLP